MNARSTIMPFLGLILCLLIGGCTTIPSCAWGKCASRTRYQALIPQTGERVYPMKYGETYEAVKEHLVKRGYPLKREDPVEGIMETEPFAEEPFARLLGIKYSWQVQVRKMDSFNTEVRTRLFVHEEAKEARLLAPGLDPEPYRYFWWKVEDALAIVTEKSRA